MFFNSKNAFYNVRITGSAFGMLLVLAGVFDWRGAELKDGSAKVNGVVVLISGDSVVTAPSDANSASQDRLEMLIDAELLVQRGIEIGLLEADRSLRKALVEAMIAHVVDQSISQGQEAGEAQLMEYYQRHRSVFEVAASYRLQRVFVTAQDSMEISEEIAREVKNALNTGVTMQEVQARFSVGRDRFLPDFLLSEKVLRNYLGPSEVDAVIRLVVGESTLPIAVAGGYVLYRLTEKAGGYVPSLEDAEGIIRKSYLRSVRDCALQQYLDNSIAAANIAIAADVLSLWNQSRYGETQ